MALKVNYPGERRRGIDERKANWRLVLSALRWLGISEDAEVDVCEDGSAYYGLTQILPRNTIK